MGSLSEVKFPHALCTQPRRKGVRHAKNSEPLRHEPLVDVVVVDHFHAIGVNCDPFKTHEGPNEQETSDQLRCTAHAELQRPMSGATW